jgi:membrane associated rhomboid family serine protease
MFVHVPSRRKPRAALATYVLVLISIVVFIAGWANGPEAHQRWLHVFGVMPGDWSNIRAATGRELLAATWNLLTALFVHANGIHLLGNLVFLLVFGASAEKPLGAKRLLFLFIVCGMAANLTGALVYSDSELPIVGSSGAVSALVGAYATLFPNSRLGLVLPLGAFFELVRMPAYGLIGLWVLVQVLMLVLATGGAAIAWPVHLAGFACGVVFALASRSSIARRLRN